MHINYFRLHIASTDMLRHVLSVTGYRVGQDHHQIQTWQRLLQFQAMLRQQAGARQQWHIDREECDGAGQ